MPDPTRERRCNVTHNPCGTDTWGSMPCRCSECQRWLVAEIERMRGQLKAASAFMVGGEIPPELAAAVKRVARQFLDCGEAERIGRCIAKERKRAEEAEAEVERLRKELEEERGISLARWQAMEEAKEEAKQLRLHGERNWLARMNAAEAMVRRLAEASGSLLPADQWDRWAGPLADAPDAHQITMEVLCTVGELREIRAAVDAARAAGLDPEKRTCEHGQSYPCLECAGAGPALK